MKTYLIREDLAHAVIGYLATKPYQEVAPLVMAMQHMQEHAAGNGKPDVEPKDDHPG